jgi:hypothetical protein
MLDEVMEEIRASADAIPRIASVFVWVPVLVAQIHTLLHAQEELVKGVRETTAKCPHCKERLTAHLTAARDYLNAVKTAKEKSG